MDELIQVSSCALIGNEKRYVNECLDRGELSWHGEFVTRFERAFAEFCGVAHAITCCNGTAALHLALLAAGIRPGDDVFLPALTYVATANAVRYVGATPIFCDVDPDTWNLDPVDVRRQIQRRALRRPGAIMAVHLYGLPARMDLFRDIADEHGLLLIEDAAEAHGAWLGANRAGGLGDVGTFSFFANKLLTTGEGGMVTTNSAAIDRAARHFRGQGQSERRFHHDVVGYNYRMTNIQAAIGLAQLEDYVTHAEHRSRVCDRYAAALEGRGFQLQYVDGDAVSANWLFACMLPGGVDAARVGELLMDRGIETRPMFVPLTEMPPYAGVTPPCAAAIASRGICLPTHTLLTDVQIDRVVEELLEACR